MNASHLFAESDRSSPGSAAGRTVQPSGWHSTETAARTLEGQSTRPAMKTEKEAAAGDNCLFWNVSYNNLECSNISLKCIYICFEAAIFPLIYFHL